MHNACKIEYFYFFIINEQSFAWLELLEDFSTRSNKKYRTDNFKIEANNISILFSKIEDFLN